MRFRKIIIAILCFAIAGYISYWIKEIIDTRYPEYALPTVKVTADGQPLEVSMSDCSWSFLNGETYVVQPPDNLYDVSLPHNAVLGGEQLEIQFSQKVQVLRIYRSEPYSYNFIMAEEDLVIPYDKGGYIYQVYAQFERGYEMIYFYVVVE